MAKTSNVDDVRSSVMTNMLNQTKLKDAVIKVERSFNAQSLTEEYNILIDSNKLAQNIANSISVEAIGINGEPSDINVFIAGEKHKLTMKYREETVLKKVEYK